ncbi:MAG TPA: DMT family transporter [Pelagibacterium sp.]|uniref:DMT family transporter n=1 Tax=Pelagibacterium sp. TaxID=1967288 RepID=UPI002C342B78|nr:DMT family transporter [Pelagibacterium sp.]HWJ88360.1 DMT family transporter [Pelagibacterium sp.]
MPVGVLFAFAAYASFAFGDAAIKSFGDTMSVFQIAFFITAFSFVPALLTNPRGERWRDVFKLNNFWLMQLRGVFGIISMVMVTVAFTTIPLAEVYALVFLTPILVTILSVVILREHMSPMRWVVLAIGFCGVMLVVRPGFRSLEFGHLSAVIAAIGASGGAIVLKKVSATERRISLLGVLLTYALVFNGIAMIPEFIVPTAHQFAMLSMIGLFIGTGHLLMIAATRRAAANQIAPAQYSQIFWAILLGGIFYGEHPDAIAVIGLTIVVAAGIATPGVDAARAILGTRMARFARRRPAQAPVSASEEAAGPETDSQPVTSRAVP